MCLQQCVKFIVFAFNLIFLIIGAALITVGAIYLAHLDDVTKGIPDQYSNLPLVPIFTVVAGSLVFLISFFGCCGAIRNNTCLLTTYAVILFLIFILQLGLGIFAFLEIRDQKDLKTNVYTSINDLFSKYGNDNSTTETIDFIQQQFHCCGTYGPDFWINDMKKLQPASCYKDKNTTNSPYGAGCKYKFFEFLEDAARVIGIVLLSLSAVEVVGAVFSLWLVISIKNDIRRGEYY